MRTGPSIGATPFPERATQVVLYESPDVALHKVKSSGRVTWRPACGGKYARSGRNEFAGRSLSLQGASLR
jgi:hypothetical protein